MCKKTNLKHTDVQPVKKRRDDHQPAKKVVPELENEVLKFSTRGQENKMENYEPLAKKLHKYGYCIKTFLKYWKGKPLTDKMLINLQKAFDVIQGGQEPVNKQLMNEEELLAIAQ